MALLDVHGEVRAAALGDSESIAVAGELVEQLYAARVLAVDRRDATVSFRGGPFNPVSNRTLLTPIDSGWVEIQSGSPSRLTYTVSLRHFAYLYLASIAVSSVAVVVLGVGTSREALWLPLLFCAIGGAYIAVALTRFRSILARAAIVVSDGEDE